MLIWRLILEEYGPEIEYIQGKEDIVTHELSRSNINGNQENTRLFANKKEIMSEINDIE